MTKKIKIAVIGLGYVGLPVAICFARKYQVVGYDTSQSRVDELNNYIDVTNEISTQELANSLQNNLKISQNKDEIKGCNVYIITVPTPIKSDKSPDLNYLLEATKMVGELLTLDDIVIYESTVFPGCTEEECVPLLEKHSKLKFNEDFFCGYSPERINPGDKNHRIENIVKVTSGSTKIISEKVDKLYKSVIDAGTFKAESIKIAEAAKVIENAQRDINIAFVNELAKIFSKMKIDTNDVLDAASTKWNFLNFRPGLVGGHCIGVDPYYLSSKSQQLGYNPEIILSGRKVNDEIGEHVAEEILELLSKNNHNYKKSKCLILGATFKENCPDFRNTRVIDIINTLIKNEVNVDIYDPWVEKKSFSEEYGLNILNQIPKHKYEAIVLAVSHDCFKEIEISKIRKKNSIIYDVKGFLDKSIITKRL